MVRSKGVGWRYVALVDVTLSILAAMTQLLPK